MTTMNRKQLLAILRYLKAPVDAYDLGTNMRLDACYDVEQTDQGWETYLAERGSKYYVQIFDNETDACLELLHSVMHLHGSPIIQPMNHRQTISILNYLCAPASLYCLHSQHPSAHYFDMNYTAQGWEVFFAANGEKRDIAVFDNETDACLDLLYRVMHR